MTKKQSFNIKNLSYEAAIQRLEAINGLLNQNANSLSVSVSVSSSIETQETLEKGINIPSLTLEQLCSLYEEGQMLLKYCEDLLNQAQQRIEIATEDGLISYK